MAETENLVDVFALAEEICDGKRLLRTDNLSFFKNCNLQKLTEGADLIRKNIQETALTCVRLLTDGADIARKTANFAHRVRLIILPAKFILFLTKKKL